MTRVKNVSPVRQVLRSTVIQRGGGTLIDVLIATVLAGVLLVPVLRLLGYTTVAYNRRALADQAHALATELLAEILTREFEDVDSGAREFGPESDESTRSQFDDVDDYDGLFEAPPANLDGSSKKGCERYLRIVNVAFIDPQNSSYSVLGNPPEVPPSEPSVTLPGPLTRYPLKQVRVNIYRDGELLAFRQALICDRRQNSKLLDLEGNSTANVNFSVRFAEQVNSIESAVRLLNSVPSEVAQ